eukprot:CAMPEP_0170197696 /NCGR_PEP_ID=MMETSP0040_2-20121228/66976_1 /TAXON_ID=641309 /ORGANISM="Lotharella oceanica, Strain CCMP622" /LENGTH=141 /DNA_ID=CAMNT_0010447421 /DNA_START=72 /DNA_END=494 /DNA_ORIENTATION=+
MITLVCTHNFTVGDGSATIALANPPSLCSPPTEMNDVSRQQLVAVPKDYPARVRSRRPRVVLAVVALKRAFLVVPEEALRKDNRTAGSRVFQRSLGPCGRVHTQTVYLSVFHSDVLPTDSKAFGNDLMNRIRSCPVKDPRL